MKDLTAITVGKNAHEDESAASAMSLDCFHTVWDRYDV
jgi:hypothetical protein